MRSFVVVARMESSDVGSFLARASSEILPDAYYVGNTHLIPSFLESTTSTQSSSIVSQSRHDPGCNESPYDVMLEVLVLIKSDDSRSRRPDLSVPNIVISSIHTILNRAFLPKDEPKSAGAGAILLKFISKTIQYRDPISLGCLTQSCGMCHILDG